MKKHHFLFNCIAVGCFSLFVILNFFISNGEYSALENRYLQGVPDISFKNIADRTFMDEAENYSSDQLMFRNFFVRVKAMTEKLMGKKENNGVYFSADNYLIEKPSNTDNELIEKNIQAVRELSSLDRFDISVCIIPQAFEVLKDKLPEGTYRPAVAELSEKVSQALGSSVVKVLDPGAVLGENKDKYIFYRTDHHQTAEGSYLVYKALGGVLGYEPLDASAFRIEKVAEDFLGTTYSKGLVKTEPDTVSVYRTDINSKATAEFFGENKKSSSMFFPEHLEKKDKYSYFLDGNHGITVISGGKADGGSIAVFKDSYAHSLAPFLINHFESIHLIDMRYYQDDPLKYLSQKRISKVLFLYGSSTFMSDTTIGTIGEFAKTSPYARFGLVKESERANDAYFDDAVFLGDSLTVGFQAYSGIDNAEFLCRTSMSVGGVFNEEEDGTSLLEKVRAAKPGKIYVMLGVNEYIVPDNKALVMEKYSRLIDVLKAENPDAKIYMQSVFPYSKEKDEAGKIKNSVIYDYNKTLLEMSKEKQVYFVDVFNAVVDDEGFLREELTSDGVHLGVEGCGLWAEYLRRHAIGDAEDFRADTKAEKTFGGEKNLEAIASRLRESVRFEGETGITKTSALLKMYNIDPDLVADAYGLVGGGATAEELSLFEVKDEENGEMLEKLLEDYVKTRIKSFEGYIPKEVPKLKNAVIYRKGKLVALVVAKETGNVKKALEKE